MRNEESSLITFFFFAKIPLWGWKGYVVSKCGQWVSECGLKQITNQIAC